MQAPGVKGIQAFRQGLGDCPCLTPIEQNWEDVGPVEVHLVYMGVGDLQMFFSRRQKHSLAIAVRRNISASLPPSCEIRDPR